MFDMVTANKLFLFIAGSTDFGVYEVKKSLTPFGWAAVILMAGFIAYFIFKAARRLIASRENKNS